MRARDSHARFCARPLARTHAHRHACARTRARTRAQTRAHTRTHTHTHTQTHIQLNRANGSMLRSLCLRLPAMTAAVLCSSAHHSTRASLDHLGSFLPTQNFHRTIFARSHRVRSAAAVRLCSAVHCAHRRTAGRETETLVVHLNGEVVRRHCIACCGTTPCARTYADESRPHASRCIE